MKGVMQTAHGHIMKGMQCVEAAWPDKGEAVGNVSRLLGGLTNGEQRNLARLRQSVGI